MKTLIFMLLSIVCFSSYAGNIDSCASNGNVLWEGLHSYKGPSDKEKRIKDVIDEHAEDFNNALTVAVWFGYDGIIRNLIDNHNVVYKYGPQSLYLAASMGRLHEMSMLLDAGVSPNAEIRNGFTPIYGAAEYGCVRAMQLLVDSGANVNHRANIQWTLLEDAVISKRFAAARFLVVHSYTVRFREKKRIEKILQQQGNASKYRYIFGINGKKNPD